MKFLAFITSFCILIVLFACVKEPLKAKEKQEMQTPTDTIIYSYLALGDSYTIGESVPYEDCFPAQTVKILKDQSRNFLDPVIIAKTGWTTDELAEAITLRKLSGSFDFVSLLIGVNNQYRGRDTANYRKEFTQLLDTALKFAGNKTDRVIVLSIPDWGITPFGLNSGRNIAQVSKEIDWFNGIAKWVTEQHGIEFIDITVHSRTASSDPSLIAADGLHPSGIMYAYWAKQLSQKIMAKIK
jgi:lysophospholipase L1-like esterase